MQKKAEAKIEAEIKKDIEFSNQAIKLYGYRATRTGSNLHYLYCHILVCLESFSIFDEFFKRALGNGSNIIS